MGNLNLQSNYRINNYDTNKTSKLWINDFNWKYNEHLFDSGIKGSLIGKFKNVNYDTKNIDSFKEDTTSELFGAIGYLAEVDLIKKNSTNLSRKSFYS